MPPWLQALLVTMIGVVPGVWAAFNVRRSQRETDKISARKVDLEAFEQARMLWLDQIGQLKERLIEANHEINILRAENKIKDDEVARLRSEVRDALALVNQLRGSLVAAGIAVPDATR